ncbi:MAG: zinc ribbon domain-containing protein [Oscillospiraceae bacterium]|nr:zinc ribbon domain-containing protein [Oscillospiraceae bacterium]
MNLFCGKCGTKFPDGTSTCAACGAVYPQTAEFAEPDIFQTQLVKFTDTVSLAEVADTADATQPPQEGETIITSDAVAVIEQSDALDEKPPRAPVSTGKRVAFAILSVVMSVIMLAAVTVLQAVSVARETVNPATVQVMARTVIDDMNIADLPVGGMIDELGINVPDFGRRNIDSSAVLSEVIYNSLHDYYVETFDISEEDVREVLNNPEFNEFILQIADNGIEYIMTNEHKGDKIVNTDDIVALIAEHAALIDGAFENYNFNFNNNDEYRRILAETLRKSELDNYRWGDVANEQVREIQDGFSLFNQYSFAALIVTIVLIVSLTAALVALNSRRVMNLLFYIGIPCAVSGAAVLLSGLFTGTISDMVIERADITDMPAVNLALEQAFDSVAHSIMLAGAITLSVGAVMIAARIVAGAVIKKSVTIVEETAEV